jgi:quaternary ammonium compound-resistance protein SugE
MAWVLLVVAGIFEIGWAVGLKCTAGFTRLWPSVATIAAMAVSVGLLGIAVRTLPIGTAYAVWTGIGTAGTVLFGILLLGDPITFIRLFCVLLIIVGVIGLKVIPVH